METRSEIFEVGDVILLENCEYARFLNGKTGVVEYITPDGNLYGSWSDCMLVPNRDTLHKIGEEHVSRTSRVLAEAKAKADESRAPIRTAIEHLLKMVITKPAVAVHRMNLRSWRITVQKSFKAVDGIGVDVLKTVVKEWMEDQKFDDVYADTVDIVEGYDLPYSREDLERGKEKHKKFVEDFLSWIFTGNDFNDSSAVDAKIEELLGSMEDR